jgi:hypothetical protein
MHALGDCAQTPWTMIHGIHRSDDSQENLRGANVARGFVATDVLLARLQCESIRRSAVCIVRNAYQSARHVAFMFIASGEICRVWSTEPERNAEALRVSDRNIGPKFSRRFQ